MRGLRAGIAVIGLMLAAHALTQSDTAFTYQGSLSAGQTPVSSSADLVFTIWDAPSSGAQISNMVRIDNVSIVDGLFTVPIDFGIAPYGEAPRWLQIAVRTPHDPTNSSPHDTLVPRQLMSRSPYSIQTRGIFVDDQNNVGIGTNTPQRQLDLLAEESIARLTSTSDNPGVLSRLQFSTADAPGIFTPIGSIDFNSALGTTIASIYGTKAGSEGGRLALRAGATTTHAQLDLLSGGNILVGDVGQIGTEADINTFFNTQGGFFGIGLDNPTHPLHVKAISGVPVIRAENTAGYPALQAMSYNDVEPQYGGVIVVGETDETNLAIDQNEIMARNNGQVSTLYLNADGGDVRMGDLGMKPLYAYGEIAADGTILSASPNVKDLQPGTAPTFTVRFHDGYELQDSDVVCVTLRGATPNGSTAWVPVVAYGGLQGKLSVAMRLVGDAGSGMTVTTGTTGFSFVVYRP